MNRLAPILFLLLLVASPLVLAEIDFEQGLTAEEETQIDQILAPVMKVYNFIKYAATVIGVLVIVFAGITFVTSGGEQAKKEKAKNMATGVVVGLIVIWIAPLVVKFVFV
jgi:hypothetical protein